MEEEEKKKCKNYCNECPFRLDLNVLNVMTPVTNWTSRSKNENNLDKRSNSAVNGYTLIIANYILPCQFVIH
jgi:hypothetical protein